MRICLIGIIYPYNDRFINEEMGIASITSFLRMHGHDVILMESRAIELDYDKIITFCPDIVGISSYEVTKSDIINVTKKIREKLPSIYICLGGYCNNNWLKEMPSVDYIVQGEGEETFLELIETIEIGGDASKIKGLVFMENNKIIINEKRSVIKDINVLPWPARDVLSENINKISVAKISTSRGCIGNCGYCTNKRRWGGNGWAEIYIV